MTKHDVMPTLSDFIDTACMTSWRIASYNPPNRQLLLSQSVRVPEIQAFLCLWWWETHTDEAAGVSRRSWVLSAKWECWVGGLWCAHSLKSTCCALSGRNRPPETRGPYTKTQWPGCPHRASVCGTCCRRISDRGHHEWSIFTGLSFISSHLERAGVWFSIFLRQWGSYLLIFSSTKKDKIIIFGYLFFD